jgi:aspartate dehydrogenase
MTTDAETWQGSCSWNPGSLAGLLRMRPDCDRALAPADDAGGEIMKSNLRIGLAGLGAIGMAIARRLDMGIPGLLLVAAAARDNSAAQARLAANGIAARMVAAAALPEHCDVIVECAPAAAFRSIAEPAIEAGRTLVALSAGALLDRMELLDRAHQTGARILVPTGALIGLDAVRAAAEGSIGSVKLVSRKPPSGLVGAPYLERHGVSLAGLTEPVKLFEGSAREGVRGFPANVNVSAALALAGIGPDRTRLEIWADPGISRNIHHIEVEADSARFAMTIENVPSENPRTGKITALSAIACLRGLVSTLRVGS